jgi:CubicO group peptidase (beta-lactamase class C family)
MPWPSITFRRFCTLIAVALFVVPSARGASQGTPTLSDALDAIAAYAPRAMQEQGTPGLSVAITDRNATLRILTLGVANRDAQTPVTPQTRFPIGSITKSMTALALLELYDAGRLNLNAPAREYLPWFSIHTLGGPILVHELLSHTAGTPDDFSPELSYTYDVLALRAAKHCLRPERRGRTPTMATPQRVRFSRGSTGDRGPVPCRHAFSNRSE